MCPITTKSREHNETFTYVSKLSVPDSNAQINRKYNNFEESTIIKVKRLNEEAFVRKEGYWYKFSIFKIFTFKLFFVLCQGTQKGNESKSK